MNARSYSDINTYQRCPKQYEYRVVRNLERKQTPLALYNGINAHELLKHFFLALQRGATVAEAWDVVRSEANDLYEAAKRVTFEDELISAKHEIDMIVEVLERYISEYVHDWEILHVEETFIMMLENGEVVSFTPDLVIRDRNGAVWIVDHKTTSGTVEHGIPFGDMQALLYYAGVKALYPELAGFFFNRLRKKMPTMPRLTKTGKTRVADLARIDTTYEILRDFLTEVAPGLLSEETHQRRLAQLRDTGNRFFWTEQIYVNDATVDSVLEDVEWVIEQIKLSESAGRFPRHLLESRGYKDCRKCSWQPLCQAELVGWETDQLIELEFQQRGEKNPYESEDDE